MSEFRIMAQDEIYRWLDTLTRGHKKHVMTQELTHYDLARITGIPVNVFKWFKWGKNRSKMSTQRQVYLSKVIAEIENGYLTMDKTVRFGPPKVVRLENPKPRPPRFYVKLTPSGPRIQIESRPELPKTLPQIKGIRLTKG